MHTRSAHRLRDGRNRLSFVTDHPPVFAIVDPFVLRIDRSPADNAKEVTRD